MVNWFAHWHFLSVCLFICQSIQGKTCPSASFVITETTMTAMTMTMMLKRLVYRRRLLFHENDGVCQDIRWRWQWKDGSNCFRIEVTMGQITQWIIHWGTLSISQWGTQSRALLCTVMTFPLLRMCDSEWTRLKKNLLRWYTVQILWLGYGERRRSFLLNDDDDDSEE